MQNNKIRRLTINGTKQNDHSEILENNSNYIQDLQIYDLSSNRVIEPENKIDVHEDHFVEIVFEDESTWIGPVNELPNYLGTEPDRSNEFIVPNNIAIEQTRGRIKDLALKFLKVFRTKRTKKTTKALASFVDNHLVKQEGLYHINGDLTKGDPVATKPLESNKKYLLLIHGTTTKYSGTFKHLIENDIIHASLWNKYDGNIIALNHHTLTKSPVRNALDLVKELPNNISLDIISGSRGGMIADILSRYNSSNELVGFDDEEILFLDEDENTILAKELKELNELILNPSSPIDLKIDKVIRVACPAAGTRLLSKNLDLFFNVIRNLIRVSTGGTSLLISELGTTLVEIIKQKDDPDVLPGLQAMTPRSSLVRVLNTDLHKVNGDLSIVYANSTFRGGILKGVAFILTRLIMWRDNDFVVDTSSMFQGVTRVKGIRGLQIKGRDIHHLSYYKHDEYVNSIVPELEGNNVESSFKSVTTYEDERGILGIAGGVYFNDKVTYKKDIAIIVPGILGSVLSEVEGKEKNVHWLDYSIGRGITKIRLSEDDNITATDVVASAYEKLSEHLLLNGYDVITFPYDWRKSVPDSGARLEVVLNQILNKRSFNKDIKIIAHSMGGLVLRDIIINHKPTFDRLQQRDGFQMMFLGTPWKGSLLILEMLVGQGKRFNSIKYLSLFKRTKDLLEMFSRFPGALQLLPISEDKKFDFTVFANWTKLKRIYPKTNWLIPPKKLIQDFFNFKESLYNQDGSFKKFELSKAVYIAGQSDETAYDYRIGYDGDDPDRRKMEFIPTPRGDSSVTWDSGIPEDISKYYVKTEHGDLACDEKLFDGFLEILKSGHTLNRNFSKTEPPTEDIKSRDSSNNAQIFPIEAHPILSNNKKALISNLLNHSSADLYTQIDEDLTLLNVTVSLGDLSKSEHPVMVGRFDEEELRGAEWAIDLNLNGELRRLLEMDLYPLGRNTSRVVLNRENKESYFEGGIIVGLGRRDKITGYVLESSITRAALDYVMNHRQDNPKDTSASIGISSVLIGSIYGKLSTENSLDSIVKGISRANEILKLQSVGIQINHLEIIELYKERSEDILLSLLSIEENLKDVVAIKIDKKLKVKEGWLLKMPRQYRDSWFDQYTIISDDDPLEELPSGIGGLIFRSNLGSSREVEVKSYGSQDIVYGITSRVEKTDWDSELFKSLFEYLIPNEFKPNFKMQSNIELILDEVTAHYPWEMMITELNDQNPIAVNASIIRRFITSNPERNLNYVLRKTAFLIGNPFTDNKYSNLPGARRETDVVQKILEESGYKVSYAPESSSKLEYMTALLSREYKIIHIAAHGMYIENQIETEDSKSTIKRKKKRNYAKIIVGPGEHDVITTFDLSKMGYVPEIAFINCCHLGVMNDKTETEVSHRDKFKLAPSIARHLIDRGYKAVIVAGWAVNDGAAKVFAEEFYRKITSGHTLGMAVKSARQRCFIEYKEKNTWGAYQCYGNPDYTLEKSPPRSGSPKFNLAIEANIALMKLLNQIKFDKKTKSEFEKDLERISNKLANSIFDRDLNVNLREAECYAELDLFDKAISKYQKIKDLGSSSIPFRVNEQICNLTIRNVLRKSGKINEKLSELDKQIVVLQGLNTLTPSREKYAMIGSAYKRKLTISWSSESINRVIASYYDSFLMLGKNPMYKDYNYALFAYLKAVCLRDGNFKRVNKTVYENFGLKKSGGISKLLEIIENDVPKMRKAKFWDSISAMSFEQLKLLSSTKKEIEKCVKEESMLNYFRKAWISGGTYRQRSTEIEHIDFLIKGLHSVKKGKMKNVKEKIEALNHLRKHIIKISS